MRHDPASARSTHGRRARRLLYGIALAAVLALAPSALAAGKGQITVGFDAGAAPLVSIFNDTGAQGGSFLAYSESFSGGVRVARGDVNGDGVSDIITGSGAGAGPHVKVFDGATGAEIRSFFAFDAGFAGGVYVAAGDVNGDGYADIIVGAGAGAGPHVKVFDGATNAELRSFFAYGATFSGGVRVAAGDVNGDGVVDIITGVGAGGGPHVKSFDGKSLKLLSSGFAFDPAFTGGIFVAAGDVNGDGRADIIVGAGAGGGPHVKVIDGVTDLDIASFDAYSSTFFGGARVAAGDVNGDGRADIITGAGAGGGPHVRAFDGVTRAPLLSFFAGAPTFAGGVFVAGSPKGATDRVPDLHGLIGGFKLEARLNTLLQKRVTDVQNALGKGQSPCPKLNALLLATIDKAGKPKGMLPYASARRLLADTNSIAVDLHCIAPTATGPLVEDELVGLVETVDGMRLGNGETNVLIGLLRKAGDAAVTGSPCQALADFVARIGVDSGRPNVLPAVQYGLLLPAVRKIQSDAGCVAGGQ